MASAFSHAILAAAMGTGFRKDVMNWRVLLLGAICAVLPDFDVIGFYFGVPYGDLWGHRGMIHSLFFAAVLSFLLVAALDVKKSKAVVLSHFLYFFICTASHGALDAMTTGGLGVAFFSPFDTTRYFFDFRPIQVSPIGIDRFFGAQGIKVLLSELTWVWVPSALFVVATAVFKRMSQKLTFHRRK
jgi:inner membrane protein